MTDTVNQRVRRLLSGFLYLPWSTRKPPNVKDAPDNAYVMADLKFDLEQYAEFLDEFEFEFGIRRDPNLRPRDETIASLCQIAESRRWPDTWRDS
jgi:hypothetical protein